MATPNCRKTFTCEVRWGITTGVSARQYRASHDDYVLGVDDEQFVFLGTLVRCTFKETERAIAEISGLTRAVLTDIWKPTVKYGRVTLQRLFTIEIRVDFKDEDKLPIFKTLIQQAGRHVYGQGALLQDGVKPEIVIHSHDFFKGHQDIPLFEDAVLSGETAVVEATSRPFDPVIAGAPSRSTGSPLAGGGEPAPDGFSEDFMRELKQ